MRLEELKDDNKSNQASLILLDNIQGAFLLKTDNGTLPNEVSAVLPASGEYLAIVAEQPLIARGNRFRGDYTAYQFNLRLVPLKPFNRQGGLNNSQIN